MDNRIGEARRLYADKYGRFTQSDAAEYFGVSLSTYKKWEQGQGLMNGAQLRDLARKYEVTTDFLLMTEKPIQLPALSPDERKLVDLFRRMDDEQKAKYLDMAPTFVVASEKDGAGSREDAELAGRAVR